MRTGKPVAQGDHNMKHPSKNPNPEDPDRLTFNQFALILDHEPDNILEDQIRTAREHAEEEWVNNPSTPELGPIIDNDSIDLGDRPWTIEDHGDVDWPRLDVVPDYTVKSNCAAIEELVSDTDDFIDLWIANVLTQVRKFRRESGLSPRLFTAHLINQGGAWKGEVAPYLGMGEFRYVDAYKEAREVIRRPKRKDELRFLMNE